jgi:hypothetical protein
VALPISATLFSAMRMIAYIDGFNLYYRALKANPGLKWLNLEAFVRRFMRSDDTLEAVKYFTARVSGLEDPGSPGRQNVYIRALKSLRTLEIHYGTFMRKEICRPLVREFSLVHPRSTNGQFVMVKSTEEKGSDVNLASYLLRDAFLGHSDAALVVSADTDLILPIRMLTRELGMVVGLINPAVNRPAAPKLAEVASFVRHVAVKDLSESQFPDTIAPLRGKPISRPARWM